MSFSLLLFVQLAMPYLYSHYELLILHIFTANYFQVDNDSASSRSPIAYSVILAVMLSYHLSSDLLGSTCEGLLSAHLPLPSMQIWFIQLMISLLVWLWKHSIYTFFGRHSVLLSENNSYPICVPNHCSIGFAQILLLLTRAFDSWRVLFTVNLYNSTILVVQDQVLCARV